MLLQPTCSCFHSIQKTPLYMAAKEGHIHAVEWLVNNGADINMETHDGVSPWGYIIKGWFELEKPESECIYPKYRIYIVLWTI